jgi:hypothetical protein
MSYSYRKLSEEEKQATRLPTDWVIELNGVAVFNAITEQTANTIIDILNQEATIWQRWLDEESRKRIKLEHAIETAIEEIEEDNILNALKTLKNANNDQNNTIQPPEVPETE